MEIRTALCERAFHHAGRLAVPPTPGALGAGLRGGLPQHTTLLSEPAAWTAAPITIRSAVNHHHSRRCKHPCIWSSSMPGEGAQQGVRGGAKCAAPAAEAAAAAARAVFLHARVCEPVQQVALTSLPSYQQQAGGAGTCLHTRAGLPAECGAGACKPCSLPQKPHLVVDRACQQTRSQQHQGSRQRAACLHRRCQGTRRRAGVISGSRTAGSTTLYADLTALPEPGL